MKNHKTKAEFERYLNDFTPSSENARNSSELSAIVRNAWGTWVRRSDPIAFNVGYNEWRLEA